MTDREREMREPGSDGDAADYEAQPASSAPAVPTRERQRDPQSSELNDDQPDRYGTQVRERQEIDERAATTKTQPMARLDKEKQDRQGDSRDDDSSGWMGDGKWQYFAGRWDSIQAGFVDDPRRTVEQADRLVAEVIDHLAKLFKDERGKLERQWSHGGKADTEDLRVAMQRYRDFFRTLVGR
jgi:hypothetical protein